MDSPQTKHLPTKDVPPPLCVCHTRDRSVAGIRGLRRLRLWRGNDDDGEEVGGAVRRIPAGGDGGDDIKRRLRERRRTTTKSISRDEEESKKTGGVDWEDVGICMILP